MQTNIRVKDKERNVNTIRALTGIKKANERRIMKMKEVPQEGGPDGCSL